MNSFADIHANNVYKKMFEGNFKIIYKAEF